MSAIKFDWDYLIGPEVASETDCLSILKMLRCCMGPQWIVYVQSLILEVQRISKKHNTVDMLSRVQFGLELDDEEVPKDFFASDYTCRVGMI